MSRLTNDEIRNRAISIIRNLTAEENRLTHGDLGILSSFLLIERTDKDKLTHYKDLEEQGRLIETIRCKDCGHFTLDHDGYLGYCRYWDNYNSHLSYCSGAKLAELKGTEE